VSDLSLQIEAFFFIPGGAARATEPSGASDA
jgi:hypothetical protein